MDIDTRTQVAAVSPLAYTVADAVRVSGIGRTTLYSLMGQGRLPIVKIGNRTLIRRIDLENLLSSNLMDCAAQLAVR